MEPDVSAGPFPSTWQDVAKEKWETPLVEDLVGRFEQMLTDRDQELFRRIDQVFGRFTVPVLAASNGLMPVDASHSMATNPLGTASAQTRMSKAAVEMKLRELCEMSKAAERVYNVIPAEVSKVLNPRAGTKGKVSKAEQRCSRGSIQNMAKKLVGNWIFEGFLMAAILGHCIVIGIQINILASGGSALSALTLEHIQQGFAVVFAIELCIRFAAEGCSYFYNSANLAWNYLDTFLVIVATVEIFSQLITTQSVATPTYNMDTMSNMRVIRIIRVTRLLRILRIMRLVRFVRSLRNLVSSIAMTMRSLGWSVMLLVIIIYMFGILITDGVTDYMSNEGSGSEDEFQKEQLRLYFGSVHSAMHTLFRSISNGLSWDVVIRPLIHAGWLWGYVFSLYIVFTMFAVLNVITAVFCQSTIEGAARDKELLAESHLLNKERYYLLVEDLFQNLRSQDSDKVTLQNFEKRFHDTDVRAFFHGLDLEPSDAWILFSLLDNDGSGEVDSEEFVEGLLKLKGLARAIDMAVLGRDLKTCIRQTQSSQQRLRQLEAILLGQVRFMHHAVQEAEVEKTIEEDDVLNV